MIIQCFRCDGTIATPDDTNSDYIIADDLKTEELREVLWAVIPDGKDKVRKIKVHSIKQGKKDNPTMTHVEATEEMEEVQKTGIVHPECYLPTDVVIWGVHK